MCHTTWIVLTIYLRKCHWCHSPCSHTPVSWTHEQLLISSSSTCRHHLVPVSLDAEHLPDPPFCCWRSSCPWLSPGASVAWLSCLIRNFDLSSSSPWTINLLRAVAQAGPKKLLWSQGISHTCQKFSSTWLLVILIFPTFNCKHNGEVKENYQRYCPQPHMNRAVIPAGDRSESR